MNNQSAYGKDKLLPDKIRVLHIDDEEDFLYLTKEFIEKMSGGEIEVESLRDSAKVIDRLKSNEIDVVVCDYLMEDLNGLDLLKTIKQENLNIPFIIFTGRGREEVVIDALNLGASYYLRKGSDARSQYAELVHQIKTAIRHKKAEEILQSRELELKKERDLLQLFLNEASAMFVIIDSDENVELMNKKVTSVLGYKEKDLIGKNWFTTVYTSDISDEVRFSFQQVIKGMKKPSPYTEIECITKSGDKLLIAWQNTVIQSGEGKNLKLLGVGNDITRRKAMEVALRNNEERYRSLVETSPYSIVLADMKGQVTYANQQAAEMHGLASPDELIGSTLLDYTAPEDHSIIKEKLSSQSFSTLKGSFEYSMIRKDGTVFPVEMNIAILKGEDGKPTGLMSIGRDLTDVKEAQKKIKESEARYRGFVENFDGIAFQGSIGFKPFFFHGAVEQITGYTESDFVEGELSWDDVVLKDDIKKLLEIRTELENTLGFSNVMEYRIRRKDGQIRWIRQHIQNISVEGDEGFVVQGSLIDISDKKFMEQELRASEALYRTIFENTGLANLIITKEKLIKMVNSKFVELTGYSKEEAENKLSWTEIVDLKDAEKLVEIQKKFELEPGTTPDNFDIKFRDKLGNVKDAYIAVKAIPNAEDFIVTIQDITKMKSDEQKLKESANLYKTLFESTGTLMAIAREDTIVEIMNDQLESLSGYTKEEVEGKMSWTDFIPDSEKERLKEINRRRLENPSSAPERYEAQVIDRNGKIYTCLIHVGLIPETNKYVISMTDISEAKRAEQEYVRTANLYRTIFEATGTANIIIGPNRIIKQVNAKVEELTGFKPKELIGQNWSQFVSEDTLSKLLKFSRSRAQRDEILPEYIETDFINKEGETRTILLNLTSIPNTGDYVVSFFDISRMKKAAEETRKSEILYRTVFESTGMANVIYNNEAKIVLVNSKMEKLSGYEREELEGRKWSEFIPQPELSMMQEYMRGRMIDPNSVPDQYETKFIDKEGNIIGILVAVTYIPHTNNFLATVADISETQREKDKLAKQKRELSDFAHLMAHDIRNCLSSIEGYVDLVLENDSSPEQYLVRINKQTEYMRKLLDRSIELAEAGLTVEKSDKVDLNDLIQSIALMMIPENIKFQSDSLFTVRADKEKLSQIIKNLLENAVKHGQPKLIEVKIQEMEEVSILKFINDGKLINREIIMEAFDTAFTTKEKESIHGLAIVKRLVEAHNWDVNLCEIIEKPCFNIIIPKEDIVEE